MGIETAVFLNPFLSIAWKMTQPSSPRTKMLARYMGQTEYYDKVSDCPPVTLYHGKVYQIEVQKKKSMFNNGWTIVRVYNYDGTFLTWVPYSVDYRKFWHQV